MEILQPLLYAVVTVVVPFVGRSIARWLKRKTDNEENSVVRFIALTAVQFVRQKLDTTTTVFSRTKNNFLVKMWPKKQNNLTSSTLKSNFTTNIRFCKHM